MCGNNMSVLYSPIKNGDTDDLRKTLARFGPAVPLLLTKQFTAEDGTFYSLIDFNPIYCSPLHFCIMRNQAECLRILLEAGGDPREKGKGGLTLLHRACKRKTAECVETLLEFGANIYDTDEWGVYPIHVCVGAQGDSPESLKILDLLLEAGQSSDVHLTDNEYKKSPLHYAAFYGNTKICRRLVELGADINAKDRTERTPYQSAEYKTATQRFLRECGAVVPETKPK